MSPMQNQTPPVLFPLFLSALAYGLGGLWACLKVDRRLARDWVVSFLRSAVQLGILGTVFLSFIRTPAWKVLIPALLIMTGFAVQALGSRAGSTYPRFHRDGAQVLGLVLIMIILPSVYLGVPASERETIAQLLPWIGILLGNALSGLSLGVQDLVLSLKKNSSLIEQELAWGLEPAEILKPLRLQALRTAMTPILNSMTVAGIVNIPGVMTGQLIAGVHPLQAVQAQLAILMLVAVTVFFGVFLFSFLLRKRAFTPLQQLNTEEWSQ